MLGSGQRRLTDMRTDAGNIERKGWLIVSLDECLDQVRGDMTRIDMKTDAGNIERKG